MLLINDGSDDNSGKICDELSNHDKRIRVFHQENNGVSSARNLGLDKSNGEYIIFIDSDDYWLTNDTLESLFNTAKRTNCDILRGEYIEVNEHGETINSYTPKKHIDNLNLKLYDFLTEIIRNEYFIVLCLIKKSIIGNVRFKLGMAYLEDMRFYFQLCKKNYSYQYIPLSFYAYRKIDSSASNNLNSNKIKGSFSIAHYLFDLYNNETDNNLKIFYLKTSIQIFNSSVWAGAITDECSFKNLNKSCNIKNLRNKLITESDKYKLKEIPISVSYSPLLAYIFFRFKTFASKIRHSLFH